VAKGKREFIPSPHRFLGDRRFENPPVGKTASGNRKNNGVHSGRDTKYDRDEDIVPLDKGGEA